MCLAIPGKVTNIDGMKVTVQYPNESRIVLNSNEPIKIGNYVLVQMGVILNQVTEKEALDSWETWQAVS